MLTAQITTLSRKPRRMEVIAKGVLEEVEKAQMAHVRKVVKILVDGYTDVPESPEYHRTYQLAEEWRNNLRKRPKLTGEGLVFEITNNARNEATMGLHGHNYTGKPLGKPYAIYVHGDARGEEGGGVDQAFMHLGKWPSLVEALDREAYRNNIRAAVRKALALGG